MLIFIIIKLLSNEIDFINIIFTLLGLDFDMNLDPTMWYISYIFVFYLLAWIYYRYKSRLRYIIIAIIWFLTALFGYWPIVWHGGTVAWAYIFSFPLGFIVAKYRNITLNKIYKLLLLITFIICTIIFCFRYGKPHGAIELLCYSEAAAFTIMCLVYFLQKNNILVFNKVINTFGVYSYFMYLNEGILLSYKNIFINYIQMPYLANIVIIFLSFIIAKCMKTVFDILVQHIMEKR